MRQLAAALLVAGCGTLPHPESSRATSRPPIAEDPLAALPAGGDAVFDIDVAQLRAWPAMGDLRARLAGVIGDAAHGIDLWRDVDWAGVTVNGLGSDAAETTWVVRGRLAIDRLRDALATREGRAEMVDYHGREMVDGARSSLALVATNIIVIGPRAEVRRSIDVTLGNEEGIRSDRSLMDPLSRSPTAKHGRAAVVGVLRATPALRARLGEQGFEGLDRISWLAGALAVGDGIDLGLLLGAHDPAEAERLTLLLRRKLGEVGERPALRLVGLGPLLRQVKWGRRNEEVHLGWRLDGPTFGRLARLGVELLRVAGAQRAE